MANFEQLHPRHHGQLRVNVSANYGFARHWESLELHMGEWREVALQQAILFSRSASGEWQSVAWLPSQRPNCWGAQGQWLADYVPSLLRLHPFALLPMADGDSGVCVDVASPWLSRDRGWPLFEPNGQISAHLMQVMRQLKQWQARQKSTQKFIQSLDRLSLLVPCEQASAGVDGHSLWQVDRNRLDGLSAAGVLLLRRQAWLKPIYAHLVSLAHLHSAQRHAPSQVDDSH